MSIEPAVDQLLACYRELEPYHSPAYAFSLELQEKAQAALDGHRAAGTCIYVAPFVDGYGKVGLGLVDQPGHTPVVVNDLVQGVAHVAWGSVPPRAILCAATHRAQVCSFHDGRNVKDTVASSDGSAWPVSARVSGLRAVFPAA